MKAVRAWNAHGSIENRSMPAWICGALLLLVLLSQAGSALAAGPAKLPAGLFSTQGNQIVDRNHLPVRLACVYWSGMNARDSPKHRWLENLDGPYIGVRANVQAIADAGFNCIRVDFNNYSLHAAEEMPAYLARLDEVVAAAAKTGLRVIINDHNNEGIYAAGLHTCAAQQVNGIWYDKGGASAEGNGCGDPATVTQEIYRNDWVFIAARYAGNDTVIGYDLWNEPLSDWDASIRKAPATWGSGKRDHDIRRMYQEVGSAILAKDPGKLIFTACPATYSGRLIDGSHGQAPWGDCTGARRFPVAFTVDGKTVGNKTVYVVHLYPDSIAAISHLFGGSSSSGQAIQAMNQSFGFLESQNLAPVWNGESGTGFAHDPDDRDWANMLEKYLNGKLAGQGGPSFSSGQQGMGFAWMSWKTAYGGPASDDMGILNWDKTLNQAQMHIVRQLLYYPKPSVGKVAARPVQNSSSWVAHK